MRVDRFERIVDDDDFTAAPGKRTADRGRETKAPGGGFYFSLGVLAADSSPRKDLPIERMRYEAAEIV
jgi:hypothetical protein